MISCSKDFTLSIAGPAPVILPVSLPDGTKDAPYSQALTVSTGIASNWTISAGALPIGLNLSGVTGIISGTPIFEEDATFTARCKVTIGGAEQFITRDYTIHVGLLDVCPDWSALAWDAPILTGGGTFVPDSAPAASFTAHCDFANASHAYNTGHIAGFNSSGCDCNLHVEWTKNVNEGSAQVAVQVSGMGTIFSQALRPLASGSYDFPFSIPDTTGTPRTITVEVNFITLTGDFTAIGTLSNV